jgi:hypothetical protein
MNWLRTIFQKLSYKLGFVRGLRGRPFALLGPFEMHQRFPAQPKN